MSNNAERPLSYLLGSCKLQRAIVTPARARGVHRVSVQNGKMQDVEVGPRFIATRLSPFHSM